MLQRRHWRRCDRAPGSCAGPSFGSVISPLTCAASIQAMITSRCVEFAAGDKLKQGESRAVERVIARSRRGLRQRGDLALECGLAIAARPARIMAGDDRVGPLPYAISLRPLLCSSISHAGAIAGVRRNQSTMCRSATRMDARRRDDIAAVAANIDARSNLAGLQLIGIGRFGNQICRPWPVMDIRVAGNLLVLDPRASLG